MPEQQEYVAPEDLSDEELYDEYQDAKENGPVERIDELQLEIAQRWEDEQVSVLVSRGHIEFDASTPQEFIDLVRETLEQSEFISTKWHEGPPDVADDVLVLREVQ